MPITHNPVLVIVSACIAIASSYLALETANRLMASQKSNQRFWLVGGAIAMGTGIWSMHFVAMLAFSIPLYVTYDLPIVLLSLLLAILASLQALFVVSRPSVSTSTLLGGSVSMGIGIAMMHYSGMAAMRMPATVGYNSGLFALSILVAVVVSLAALTLSVIFRDEKFSRRFGLKSLVACVMGGAILSMHYTGMSAASFTHQPEIVVALSGIDNAWLAAIVCTFTLLVLGAMGAMLYGEAGSIRFD
ncbi:MHYT domain-containing protein [Egbenema bharatensis]|uniref:MHYT domain-containing protein n=1 Tax=Egbenema bharatensis TaxID=3463334 RepID=UPI003A8738B4